VSNPILSDRAFSKAANDPGWGAPDMSSRATPVDVFGPPTIPVDDGPTSPWTSKVMTVEGAVTATGVLLVLLVASAVVGWNAVEPSTASGFPPLALVGVGVGFVCVLALMFKPMWAKVLAPVYALAQGFFVGVVSHFYDAAYDGIVIQAVGATLAVFGVMLFLYKTRIIKVTNRFRRIVVAATMGLMAFYLVTFVLSLFGIKIGAFMSDASPLGIAFSIFAAGLAAFNLALDFDFIERGSKANLPKGMEWVAAFGLLVTLVWLYLELLRLLAKLQRR
jgi:uncharacterized YccA/Bax inhibitor family protein